MKSEFQLLNKNHLGLAWAFRVNPDACGNNRHYENYIKFVALNDKSEGRGTTHIFIRTCEHGKKILGYITFKATALIKHNEDTVFGDPALEIAELAVSADEEHRGIGTLLVQFAFTVAADLNYYHLGIRYITLCADAMAAPFYQRFGFERIDKFYEVPREGWNINCVPMFIRLPGLPPDPPKKD